MTHLAEASHSHDDPSFNVALKERDFQRNSHYLNGVCEGRRLQREYSQTQADQLELCRAERDVALESASQHLIDLCVVREQLEKLGEEYRALQDLFEEVAEFNMRGTSSTSSWSPSIDAWVLEESLYDVQPGLEGGVADDPWLLAPDSPTSNVIQLPTPAESSASSVLWPTSELPSSVESTYLETTSPIIPTETSEPPHLYSIPSPYVAGDEPQATRTLVEKPVEEDSAQPCLGTPKTVGELQALMNDAYMGDEHSLALIKLMYTQAHGTPRHQKTFIQQFLLCNWQGVSGQPLSATGVALPPVDKNPTGAKLEIFVDSAASWGIGFIKDGRWLAWKFKRGWDTEGRDNSWGEMVAVELGLRVAIAAGHRSRGITVRSDNSGVVRSLVSGISRNFQQNLILQKILQLCRTYNVRITPEWISTKLNPADKPSRGMFAPRGLLFPNPPPLPAHLADFLHPPVEYRTLLS